MSYREHKLAPSTTSTTKTLPITKDVVDISATSSSSPVNNGSEHRFPSLSSIFPDLRLLTTPLQRKFSKISPFLRRKCGLSGGENNTTKQTNTKNTIFATSENLKVCANANDTLFELRVSKCDPILLIKNTSLDDDVIISTEDCVGADNLPESKSCCRVIVHEDETEKYTNIPICRVKQEEECTAVERSLPWRRGCYETEQPALSCSSPAVSLLEDLPQLAREPPVLLNTHLTHGGGISRCWTGGGHHRHHHTSHYSHAAVHHGHEWTSTGLQLTTPVSDSAHGSSVESAVGDHHLTTTTSASTHSTDAGQHMLTDFCTAPPWSRSNSHDLPTVLEEDLDDLTRGVLTAGGRQQPSLPGNVANRKLSPFHQSDDYYAVSMHKTDLYTETSISALDRGTKSDNCMEAISINIQTDQPDFQSRLLSDEGDKSPGIRWCLSDQCSAPIKSPMCRDVGFFEDQTGVSYSPPDIPNRAQPHWRGLQHAREADSKAQSLLYSFSGSESAAGHNTGGSRRRRWSFSQMPGPPSSASQQHYFHHQRRPCCQGSGADGGSQTISIPDEIMLDEGGHAGDHHSNESRVLQWLRESRPHMQSEGDQLNNEVE